MVKMKSEPQVGVSVVTKAQTTKVNDSLTNLHDFNAHVNLENSMIMEDFVQKFLSKIPQPIFFERLHDDINLNIERQSSLTLAHTKIPFLH